MVYYEVGGAFFVPQINNVETFQQQLFLNHFPFLFAQVTFEF